MKLIKHFVELNKLREEMDAPDSWWPEKSNTDVAKSANEASQENMLKSTDAQYHAHTLENFPYCLACQTDYPDRCDCVINAKFDETFDIDESLFDGE